MRTVTYLDLEDAAPVVEVMGAAFATGEPQEVDDAVAAFVDGNPFFTVAGTDGDQSKRRGRASASSDEA